MRNSKASLCTRYSETVSMEAVPGAADSSASIEVKLAIETEATVYKGLQAI